MTNFKKSSAVSDSVLNATTNGLEILYSPLFTLSVVGYTPSTSIAFTLSEREPKEI